jgi:hypothetical protein
MANSLALPGDRPSGEMQPHPPAEPGANRAVSGAFDTLRPRPRVRDPACFAEAAGELTRRVALGARGDPAASFYCASAYCASIICAVQLRRPAAQIAQPEILRFPAYFG